MGSNCYFICRYPFLIALLVIQKYNLPLRTFEYKYTLTTKVSQTKHTVKHPEDRSNVRY